MQLLPCPPSVLNHCEESCVQKNTQTDVCTGTKSERVFHIAFSQVPFKTKRHTNKQGKDSLQKKDDKKIKKHCNDKAGVVVADDYEDTKTITHEMLLCRLGVLKLVEIALTHKKLKHLTNHPSGKKSGKKDLV